MSTAKGCLWQEDKITSRIINQYVPKTTDGRDVFPHKMAFFKLMEKDFITNFFIRFSKKIRCRRKRMDPELLYLQALQARMNQHSLAIKIVVMGAPGPGAGALGQHMLGPSMLGKYAARPQHEGLTCCPPNPRHQKSSPWCHVFISYNNK